MISGATLCTICVIIFVNKNMLHKYIPIQISSLENHTKSKEEILLCSISILFTQNKCEWIWNNSSIIRQWTKHYFKESWTLKYF